MTEGGAGLVLGLWEQHKGQTEAMGVEGWEECPRSGWSLGPTRDRKLASGRWNLASRGQ